MAGHQYSKKEFTRLLLNNGFEHIKGRGNGSHEIWKKNGRCMSVPKSLNPMLIQRLCKENNIVGVIR